MFPVEEPPRVRVPIRRDWMVAVEAAKLRPFPAPPPRVAEIVAMGVPSLIPITPNSAEEVALFPSRKSRVEVSLGVITPLTISHSLPSAFPESRRVIAMYAD